MNKSAGISLITLLFTGCTGTAVPVKTAGLHGIFDPATGRTYHMPVPALRSAQALAGSVAGDVVQIGGVARVGVAENMTLVEFPAKPLTTTQLEAVGITHAGLDAAPLKLRLDTEFSSFALKRVALNNT